MSFPVPTPIYRLVHLDNLEALVSRQMLHAPHLTPHDGFAYRTIHDVSVQANRRVKSVPCGPGGSIHDYVPFYFGPLSVMLLNLKTERVEGYRDGQGKLIYLKSTVQDVEASGARFVFTDGHGLATFTSWFDDLSNLEKVDWNIVSERYWRDTPEDNDRKRRKQAEFLIWHECPWSLISEIGVINAPAKAQVEEILDRTKGEHRPIVKIEAGWYY